MKTLAMLMVVVLAGCASKPTLTELEEQALATGDWTAVEAREKVMSRLQRIEREQCPNGGTKICVQKGGTPVCQCTAGAPTVTISRN